MAGYAQEVKHFAEELADTFGKAYARILCTMGRMEFHGREETNRTSQRIRRAKLEAFRYSAVLVLMSDDYNEVETEAQAEALVKEHRALYIKAAEKDEEDRKTWV